MLREHLPIPDKPSIVAAAAAKLQKLREESKLDDEEQQLYMSAIRKYDFQLPLNQYRVDDYLLNSISTEGVQITASMDYITDMHTYMLQKTAAYGWGRRSMSAIEVEKREARDQSLPAVVHDDQGKRYGSDNQGAPPRENPFGCRLRTIY